MTLGAVLVGVGALLFIGGILFMAAQAIWRGRLSNEGGMRSGLPSNTLEPHEPASGFRLKANWPGLALIATGSVCLLAGAAV